jgi:hypothetical protein
MKIYKVKTSAAVLTGSSLMYLITLFKYLGQRFPTSFSHATLFLHSKNFLIEPF